MFGRKVAFEEVAVGPRTKAIRLRLRCPARHAWVTGARNQFHLELADESVMMLLATPGPGKPSGDRPHDIVVPIHVVGEGRTTIRLNPALFFAPVEGGRQRLGAAVIDLPVVGELTGPSEVLVEHELQPMD